MTMQRRGFGFGGVAGLVAAVLVIAGLGIFGAAPGPFASAVQASLGGGSSNPQATTTGAAYSYSTTTTVPSANSSSGSQSTAPSSTQGFFYFTAAQLGFRSVPSSLNSIPRQPASDNAVVLIPVLVALILGGALYAAGIRSRQEDSE